MEKRSRPVTSCTHCGNAGYSIGLANGRCGQAIKGKRCKGLNQSAIGSNDWTECPLCNATGWADVACVQCDGAGWLFVRGKTR